MAPLGLSRNDAVLVPDRDMAFALRLARYDMRDGPIAVPRLKFLPLPSTMAAGRTCNYGSTTRPILAARSGASS